ncbi:MAG: hypothetical protein NC911_06655 [Candidatus Omnitrophica bacterium]|nr:hypothetical protein [Candidatus Omnitrophota bacterium]MCM8769335.1 hypothetical protein [Candidatus Omnitrophota bacterium]
MPIFGRRPPSPGENKDSQTGINSARFLKMVSERYPGYEDGVKSVLFGTKPYDSFIQAGISLRRFGDRVEAEIEIEGKTLKFFWRRPAQL